MFKQVQLTIFKLWSIFLKQYFLKKTYMFF